MLKCFLVELKRNTLQIQLDLLKWYPNPFSFIIFQQNITWFHPQKLYSLCISFNPHFLVRVCVCLCKIWNWIESNKIFFMWNSWAYLPIRELLFVWPSSYDEIGIPMNQNSLHFSLRIHLVNKLIPFSIGMFEIYIQIISIHLIRCRYSTPLTLENVKCRRESAIRFLCEWVCSSQHIKQFLFFFYSSSFLSSIQTKAYYVRK